jgi:hypothetical protein
VHLFFKRNKVNLNQQIKVFEAQLLIANEMNLPIVIHCRDNELEVLPVNYKRPATSKSLFKFIEDLSAKDIVISKEYGEEMSGSSSKNKRIVFGNNISYLTSVRDYPAQLYCDPVITQPVGAICCLPDNSCLNYNINSLSEQDITDCYNSGGVLYYNASCSEDACEMNPVCSIKNNPASIGAYDSFYITPTPYPDDGETC